METRTETLTADNGATMVLATITHEGHEFTAGGGSVDLAGGHIYAYANGKATRGSLVLWNGTVIGRWHETSRWKERRGWETITMQAISAHIDGDTRRWYGRYSCDWGDLVHLRPAKS